MQNKIPWYVHKTVNNAVFQAATISATMGGGGGRPLCLAAILLQAVAFLSVSVHVCSAKSFSLMKIYLFFSNDQVMGLTYVLWTAKND